MIKYNISAGSMKELLREIESLKKYRNIELKNIRKPKGGVYFHADVLVEPIKQKTLQ